jgi:transcriptional repressor NrdR
MVPVQCPRCNASSHVVESRSAEQGAAVRRRRECSSCQFRFTTFERPSAPRLRVAKRSGGRESFNVDKLRGALTRAAHKRQISETEIGAIVNAVEAEAVGLGGVIPTRRISELCLERLALIDHGAYLQFAGTLPEITPEIASFATAGSVRSEEDSP